MASVHHLDHHHSYAFVFLSFLISTSSSTLSSTGRHVRLSANKGTIVSPGDGFELGLFRGASDLWYLGTWHTKGERRPFWVANRDNPLFSPSAILEISNSNLVLRDQPGGSVWSTGNLSSRAELEAELLYNGNFVLREANDTDRILWQSFDFPTDTLLPGMKLGWDRKINPERSLSSWRDYNDPTTGYFLYGVRLGNLHELFIWNIGGYRPGPWYRSDVVTEMSYGAINIIDEEDEYTISYAITNSSFPWMIRLTQEGDLWKFQWDPTSREWKVSPQAPTAECDYYSKCGPDSYCDVKEAQICSCIQGFRPVDQQAWQVKDFTLGCERKRPLTCNEDVFLNLTSKMNMPDSKRTIAVPEIGLEECHKRCLANCNCTAVSYTDTYKPSGGWGCVMWTGKLVDLRSMEQGQDLYVKIASPDLGGKNKMTKLTFGLAAGISVLLLLSFILLCLWIRKKKRAREIKQAAARPRINQQDHLPYSLDSETGTTSMDFDTISTATQNFSDSAKLGRESLSFSLSVLDGQEIAVKRLTKTTRQGIDDEFTNEVRLIARLQHVNLVRLVGFCVTEHDKLLVYEFLPNSSLDTYIFDPTRSPMLDWATRFNITNGIARGLSYLHHDSRVRIIHLDLKPGNVLLDQDMTPKISDFGLAKILARDVTEARSTAVVGTFGYVSPEYMNHKVCSVKSDVFSFGVMLLEIVSGKKKSKFPSLNDGDDFLIHVWSHFTQGKGLEIVDPVLKDSSSSFRADQALKCVQIGLLCVQELPEDRPTMSSVVLMLEIQNVDIPQPKSPVETASSSSSTTDRESFTVAQITMSAIQAR
ncbi:unnamed protein product [Microthlaspi erraticum]|uniref:Receptor-like serine/threonine-protein kinase n=1 Tax=Microthlaspi erraticum TaxID=1685480 RepID=A0A6D2J7M1_9BRAS|nr:unnamed protein product [Microthlaspi erraticum]